MIVECIQVSKLASEGKSGFKVWIASCGGDASAAKEETDGDATDSDFNGNSREAVTADTNSEEVEGDADTE